MSTYQPEPQRRAAAAVGVLLAALLLPGTPAAAQDADAPAQRLETIERALGEARDRRSALEREAGELAEEITSFRRRAVALAARERRLEGEITALERRSAALAEAEAEKTASLARRRTQLARMLAALQRIAYHPPSTLIALPAAPVDTLRSAMLLRAALPGIEARAAALRGELGDLAVLRTRMARTRADLARATVGLDAERDRLEALLRQRDRLAARTRAERRAAEERMARLAGEARSLQGLMEKLAEERRTAEKGDRERRNRERRERLARLTAPAPSPADIPPPAPPEAAAGPGELPVRGRIVRVFGENDGIGGKAKGITIEARAAARVVAPEDGHVVFAGPFRGLGHLLIIEHAKGYHTLLAGLARIDAEVGETVLTGEPVGILASSSQSRPALYVELRRRGRPVDPVPWLAAERTRVKG